MLGVLLAAGSATAAPAVPTPPCDTTDPNPGNTDWIDAQYTFTLQSLTSLTVTARLGIHKVDAGGDTGPISADHIRAAYAAARSGHAQAAADVENIKQSVADAFNEGINRAFPGATLGAPGPALVDEATLPLPTGGQSWGSCYGPAVAYTLTRNVTLDFKRLAGSQAKESDANTAFRVGATLEATFNLETPRGHNASYTFVLPTLAATANAPTPLPLVLAAAPAAPGVRVSENSARVSVAAWRSAAPVAASLVLPIEGKDLPTYTKQDSTLEVTLDLKDIVTSVGDLADQKLPTIDVGLEASALIQVVEVPDGLRDTLDGSSLTLTHVDARGLRLLKAEGLLNDSTLDTLETELLGRLNDKVSDFGGGSATASGGFDAATWDLSRGNEPVSYRAEAAFMLGLGGSAASGKALTLYSVSKSFPLDLLDGQATTYRLFLPDGIELVDASYDKGSATRVMRGDREGVQVNAKEDGGAITLTIGVTPAFVWAKFTGVVIGVLAVLLLIVLGIALLVRKLVRRGKKKSA